MTSSLLSLVACVFGVAPHAGGPGQREGPALLGDLCPCRRSGEGVGHLGVIGEDCIPYKMWHNAEHGVSTQ